MPFKILNKDFNEKIANDLLNSPTSMNGETFKIGCLPYSHHARARNTNVVGDTVTYSDWWGYEVALEQELVLILIDFL